ncbi:methylated-DNA--protein-cysteine methyltransferase isoform X2 [Conger conger]|uniref:methylated-DNA--protein-cysteine methyltransferase isoform X2 n=1 Tax=Conger conger TaxID=82655 RepID=UPI002A5A15D3|nr:methylated-DNA--protein-cysteine methyltransferase isoform X2 [Conger conger]
MESGLRQKAGECGLTAVTLQSPLGRIRVAGCEDGVHHIQILTEGAPAERTAEAPLACVVCEGHEEMTTPVREAADWLLAYFNDPQTMDKYPLPAFHHPLLQEVTFTSRVLQTLVREVKVGETVSYKRLAEMAGNSKAVRAVGGAMRRNPVPLLIPCHRVISSSGESGSYMGGKGNHLKEWLLTHERLLSKSRPRPLPPAPSSDR